MQSMPPMPSFVRPLCLPQARRSRTLFLFIIFIYIFLVSQIATKFQASLTHTASSFTLIILLLLLLSVFPQIWTLRTPAMMLPRTLIEDWFYGHEIFLISRNKHKYRGKCHITEEATFGCQCVYISIQSLAFRQAHIQIQPYRGR